MANNAWITESNVVVTGSAQDSTQTDNFTLSGADDYIVGIGGNINVTGLPFPPSTTPTDTGTTILLTSNFGEISGVTDNFSLHGNTNALYDFTPTVFSTINDTVLGNGGANSVYISDAALSDVTVAIGVDPTATAPAGGNTVDIYNYLGTNTVSLGGPNNVVDLVGGANTVWDGGTAGNVTLNGDATNSVTFASGGATATIGSTDDNLFGYSSMVTFAGTGNLLNGGDEDYTVSGSTGNSTVHVGDGENFISMGGANNTVSVWGGDNTIDAGGGNSHVKILGVDGTNTATPEPDAEDSPVPLSPTDNVMIAGANDSVSATYENVNVWGASVTSAATISLGNGNNSIILGGTGGNHVTVGNGGNTINATGAGSTYNLGDGANGVTLSGNNNTINVTDPTGVGKDVVKLGAGTGDVVKLDHAAGSVTGTGLGLTTISQTGPNAVTVNLNNGTGHITLGDGNDTVTANGSATTIKAGNGADTVTANGANDVITLGNGHDTVIANGPSDTISLGNGANSVTANGGGDKFSFGNGANTVMANGNGDTGVFGTAGAGGDNTLTATGSGDVWTFNENSASVVKATIGASDVLNQTNGSLNATLLGAGDTVNLSGVNTAGTTITANGNDDVFDFANNSGGALALNPSSVSDKLTFAGTSNDFTGTATISGLGTSDSVTLSDLYTTGGVHLTSFAQMISYMATSGGFTPTGDVLALQGGGEIKFAATTALSPTSFHFV